MITVTDFCKMYGPTRAVETLSFGVKSGEVWGLVGHNGAGKTTTMKAIAGLLPPSSGTISVDGVNVRESALHAKRKLAYLPDNPQLFEALTVAEHLQFIGSAYRLDDFAVQAADLLDFFELKDKSDRPAEDLSRGMRQKLAICCAYLHDPPAILFDEPFTGLDPKAIRSLKASIQERAASGAAIIVSSHLLAMVEDLCSHFLILSGGQAKFQGSHAELFDKFQLGDDNDTTLEEIFFRATELNDEISAVTSIDERLECHCP